MEWWSNGINSKTIKLRIENIRNGVRRNQNQIVHKSFPGITPILHHSIAQRPMRRY